MARINLAPEVICDAGPLIHLDELGCLDLLTDFSAVLVPEIVWEEVRHHRPDVLGRPAPKLTCVQVSLPDEARLTTLIRLLSLDAGEQAALALMLQHPQAILLTDDAAARLAAEQLGLRVHGTLGIEAASDSARSAHTGRGTCFTTSCARAVFIAHPTRPAERNECSSATGIWSSLMADGSQRLDVGLFDFHRHRHSSIGAYTPWPELHRVSSSATDDWPLTTNQNPQSTIRNPQLVIAACLCLHKSLFHPR